MKPLFSYYLCLSLLLAVQLGDGTLAETLPAGSVLKTIQNAVQEQQGIKDAQIKSIVQPVDAKPKQEPAEPLKAMTLEQALRAAVLRNPDFKAVQARLGVSDAELLTAGARLNPAIVSDNGIAEKTYRLGLEQTLELGGKRRLRVAVAKAQREALLAEIDTQFLSLRTTARQAYTRLYNARERRRTYLNILQVTQELFDIAKKREQAGDISKLDTLQTEILSVNANNDLQLAENEVSNAQSQLNALLNQPLTTELALAPPSLLPQLSAGSPAETPAPNGMLQGKVSQTDLDLDGLIATALSRRPEIRQNLRKLEVTDRQAALARANRIPNLALTAGADAVTQSDQKSMNAFVIGRVELPVLNRQQGPIQEAQARKLVLVQEQQALKSRITLEVSQAYTSFKANQARLQRYETQLLPYAVAVVDKSRRAFDEGKANILTAINAQQAYMNTRLGYLQALMDTQNTVSDLEKAVGAGL